MRILQNTTTSYWQYCAEFKYDIPTSPAYDRNTQHKTLPNIHSRHWVYTDMLYSQISFLLSIGMLAMQRDYARKLAESSDNSAQSIAQTSSPQTFQPAVTSRRCVALTAVPVYIQVRHQPHHAKLYATIVRVTDLSCSAHQLNYASSNKNI